ncbi:MAG: O-acetyl-ADP-ribose deacetylase [Ignavibacteriales bacterium]|nr:MAG: O-acetyl-ADP-ribose deacetylase [Ignavibacteriales bacterium]
MNERIEIYKGDITKLHVDAIVNAANGTLLGGGGVDGAIHKAAGRQLLDECKKLGGCNTGEAKITNGYNLPAKFIIHTVGPVWFGGRNDEDEALTNCYKHSLELAVKNNIRTIAFPSISTGAYGFPVERAARIAINEVLDFLWIDESIEKITFVCYSQNDFEIYEQLLNELDNDES